MKQKINVVWWQLMLMTILFGYAWLTSLDRDFYILTLLGLITALLVTLTGVAISRKRKLPPEKPIMKLATYIAFFVFMPLLVVDSVPIKGFITAYLAWFLVCVLIWQWRTGETLQW